MSYELKWEEEGYYLRMWGTITADDMQNALDEIWRDIQADKMKYCIRDYLDVTQVDIGMDAEDVSKYVATFEKVSTNTHMNPLKLVAFLSQNEEMDKIIEGYTLLMKEYNPSTIFKNFSNVEDARKWVASQL